MYVIGMYVHECMYNVKAFLIFSYGEGVMPYQSHHTVAPVPALDLAQETPYPYCYSSMYAVDNTTHHDNTPILMPWCG